MDNEEIVRVLRIVEIKGPRSLVEKQVENSLHGTKTLRQYPKGRPAGVIQITAVTLHEFPEVLDNAEEMEGFGEYAEDDPVR